MTQVVDKAGYGMAMNDHLLRFRAMSTADLLKKQSELNAQDSIYSQQSIGTKSATIDLRFVSDQLNAIAYVLTERGYNIVAPAPFNPMVGVADFSNV